MIVTNKLIKNVNFNVLTPNEDTICTETSNFTVAHILITFRSLPIMTCAHKSVKAVFYLAEFSARSAIFLSLFSISSA